MLHRLLMHCCIALSSLRLSDRPLTSHSPLLLHSSAFEDTRIWAPPLSRVLSYTETVAPSRVGAASSAQRICTMCGGY